MKDIRTWLDGDRDFTQGQQLYEKHGKDQANKILFSLGDTPLGRKKLAPALEAMLNEVIPIPEKTGKYARRGHFPSDDLKAPEPVRELVARRRFLYQQTQRLQSVLHHMSLYEPEKFTDAQRGKKALELLDIWDEIGTIWFRTNHYDEKGYLPEPLPKVTVTLQPGELVLRALNNKRSQLSKCRSGRLKLDIPTIEAEIIELEKMLEEEQ